LAEQVNPYAHVRGFNYQPSYDFSGHGIWRHFQPDTIDRELGQGKQHFPGINTVRLWLSFDAFMVEPARVGDHFATALAIADQHALKVIPTLFNNWHSVPDFGGVSLEAIRHWSDEGARTIPANPFLTYVETIVGAHAADDRILLWDLCNEPFNSGYSDEILRWLESVYVTCKALGAQAPISVGVPPDNQQLEAVTPISDVVTIHPYGDQAFVEAAVAVARGVGKPILVTECCWGAVDDAERAAIVTRELTALSAAGLGFVAHVLHHSLVADCHREQYGPISGAGYMAFIEADGSLRPHHEVFNTFV
jgi:endo-1,4-beta-mannosidase